MMTGSGGGGNNKWTDEQEWERKKAYQKAMMARGKGPDAKGLGNGALGVAGIGSYAQQQASQGTAAQPTYPTPADLPKYNSLAEKQQAQKDAFANIQEPGFGMGYSVKPNVPQKPIDNMRGQGVANLGQNSTQASASEIQPTYQEGESTGSILKGNGSGKRPGLSIDNNAAVAQPLAPQMGGGNSARGFGVMAAPRKAYGEDSRRQALAMDIKPYKNGMGLTTGQIALKNSIIMGDDQKYANEQYGAQLGAAQQLAQEGMQQAGANSRTEIGERGANSRANSQLGFDAEKFQQLASLDKRKLDMQQSNDNVANFAPKEISRLYKAFQAAETPEEQAAIREQMNILSGGSDKRSKSIVINQTGQTLSPDGLTATDNPAVIYNQDDNSFINIPQAERGFSDPAMIALQARTDISAKEKEKLANLYLDGGDI